MPADALLAAAPELAQHYSAATLNQHVQDLAGRLLTAGRMNRLED